MSTVQETPTDIIDEWISFDEAYEDFRKAHPAFGLSKAEWAAVNLRRNFGERLMQSGAVRQLINRRWIAHRKQFPPVLFNLLTRSPSDIIEKAQARQEGQS